LILQESESPGTDVERLFRQFADAAFGDPDDSTEYWSNVRKFKIGNTMPLPTV